jgi:hypothetical protein
MHSTHGEDQLERSGPAVPAGGDGDAFVIVVRNVAKLKYCALNVENDMQPTW